MTEVEHGKVQDKYVGSAPYNFISLNEAVISVPLDALPDRSVWHNDRLSGTIHCTLCTESPVFVAGSDEGGTEFFHHGDPKRPVIPGSSLRGMLRTIVEIISFSKLQPITDKKLFFRDIRDGKYQPRFVSPVGYSTSGTGTLPPGTRIYGVNVKAGILRHSKQQGYSIEHCDMARITHNLLRRDLGIPTIGSRALFVSQRNRSFPNPAYQGIDITADVDPETDHPFPEQPGRHPNLYLRFRKVTGISNNPAVRRSQRGILVITGDMRNKKMEFVFLPKGTRHPDPGRCLDDIIERFESDDQITEWQEKAFPKDQPTPNSRRRDGALYDGEPIFYLEDSTTGELEFIGRAQLFRLPFGFPPSDLRYPDHKVGTALDFTESLFGFVDKPVAEEPNKKWTAAGRVSVTDATLASEPEESVWLNPQAAVFHTHILSSPKPSAYAHYLVQPDPNIPQRTNLSNHRQVNAIIRGHKLYWHQTKAEGETAAPLGTNELRTQPNPNNPEQHPEIKPIRPGLQFSFRVHFENVTNAELGALLWAIELPFSKSSRYLHKLGMGKPLGMGSVGLIIDSLEVLSPDKRLGALLQASHDAEGEISGLWRWETGLQNADKDDYLTAFSKWVEGELKLGEGGFGRHDRIEQLKDMLRWPGLKRGSANYMGFQEHKAKLVLPDARTVYSANRNTLKSQSACSKEISGDEKVHGTETIAAAAVLLPGEELRVMVIDIDAEVVYLEPIGLPEEYEDYLFYIPTADLSGRRYTIDHPARVVVAEVDEQAQKIRCRPRPQA